ncbi:MAG: malonate decarboxylase subunit epsilon [Paludibacterium sp.]|uniref:malonate decarboxylase subunit epsilon n=1 Tax=Paludibacterium sp. TaxID=1917523 RepID=UPI0025EFF23D|nr:malonate decarboxylase subunit epsilon [Paludibacterium sp.]MBV8047774.1 malonate decarboxylase subunit epsilon [Paludibacterium sp.]MBV8648766.1 malonate decarboxylase subunit epsilon [Paludibacterium sp.]
MTILFTFPGQGAQVPGMLHRLPDHPAVAHTLSQASEALGEDILALDSAAALASTRAVQLCLLVAGVAAGRLLDTLGSRPDLVAGLSIGAYPAAVVAGALDFADAVRLVALRGTLMQQAYPQGYGMTAILGLREAALAPLLAGLRAEGAAVFLANINAETQLVIAGSEADMQRAATAALAAGAHKARRLAVSVPSHCALLTDSARDLARAFAEVPLQTPRVAYLSASSARALWQPEALRDDLVNNMARQVRWRDTAISAWERGARLAVEMPPGSVLTRLVKTAFCAGLSVAFDETRVDSIHQFCQREIALNGVYIPGRGTDWGTD